MVRSFVAVELEDEIRRRLIAAQNAIPSAGAKLKLVEPQNIHLTMKFLGEVPEEKIGEIDESLKEAASGFQKFPARVKGIGVFPGLSYIKVMWAGVSEGREQIIELQKKVDAALQPLGFRLDKRFHPHATIARVKFVKDKGKLVEFIKERADEDFGEMEVQGLTLKQSTLTPKGPIYSTLADVALE